MIRRELEKSFSEDYTPHEVASSFAFGAFVTVLPTLGVGLVLFVVVSWLFERVNRIALFASALVFNPLVKSGMYMASLTIGIILLGPVPNVSMVRISLTAGPDLLIRLLVGNVIVAVVTMFLSYLLVYRLMLAYRTTALGETIDEAVEDIVDELVVE